MTAELVIDARVLVYNVTVGAAGFPEVPALDQRLKDATTLISPSCEFLRSHRMLRTLGAAGFLTPADVVGMSMLVCESGVEFAPVVAVGHSSGISPALPPV